MGIGIFLYISLSRVLLIDHEIRTLAMLRYISNNLDHSLRPCFVSPIIAAYSPGSNCQSWDRLDEITIE